MWLIGTIMDSTILYYRAFISVTSMTIDICTTDFSMKSLVIVNFIIESKIMYILECGVLFYEKV